MHRRGKERNGFGCGCYKLAAHKRSIPCGLLIRSSRPGDCQASKIVDLEKVANAASAKSGKLQKSSDQNFKLVNELREANQRMQEQVTQLQAECRTLQIRQPDLLAHVQTLQQQNGEMQRSKDSLQESIDAIVQVVPFGMMSVAVPFALCDSARSHL